MRNTYIGNCDGCTGNCKECPNTLVTMIYENDNHECMLVADLIEVLEIFADKKLLLGGQHSIGLQIDDDFINLDFAANIQTYTPEAA